MKVLTSFSTRFLWPILAIAFSLFIFWIIIMADLGQAGSLSQYVRALPFGDKAGHFLLYGVLAFLINLALKNRKMRFLNHRVLTGGFLVLIFAILEEFTQIYFRTRNFELLDIICDVLGIVFFSYLAVLVGKNFITDVN